MDGEFEKIKPHMPTVECNTTAAKEHVSEAERTIRTIKERTRGLLGTLPFQRLPRRMKIEFIYFMVLWPNAFPVKNGISSMFSPRELLVRWRLDYTKHCRVLPGTYCEVHDEPLPSNTMTPRTHEAIGTDGKSPRVGEILLPEHRSHFKATIVNRPSDARQSAQESERHRATRKARADVPLSQSAVRTVRMD